MKAFVLVVLMAATAAPIFGQHSDHKVTVLSTKMDVLYLKVTEDYVGATVTVVDTTGAQVMSATVSNKKFLVDFIDQVSGNYTVRIEKGEFSEELKYHRM